jgi:hypothetical protein
LTANSEHEENEEEGEMKTIERQKSKIKGERKE